jgi:ATP-dependent protease ClpP protease subunit
MMYRLLALLFLLAAPALAKGEVTFRPERTILLGGAISDSVLGPVLETMDNLAKTDKEIDIIISSPGGSVIVGSLIIDRMEQLKSEGISFRCIVRDVAASMAFQLLLHCNERYATPHSFLLWHPVRIFMRGVLTADMSQNLLTQLQQADEVALHDLRAYLPMKESEILRHFRNETLHQAYNLLQTAPGFFNKVTNKVQGLYPEKPALNTSKLGGLFDFNQIVYIHERFISQVGTR